MTAPEFKTKSQQKLEWYESLKRPLTDEESAELQRVMRAVYWNEWNRDRLRRAALQSEAA